MSLKIQYTFSRSLTPLFLAFLFFSFLSYVKDILEALALGISFMYAKYFRFQRELNKFLWTLKYSLTKKSTVMKEVVFLFFFCSFLLILFDDAWIALGCFYYFNFWYCCYVLFKIFFKHVLSIFLLLWFLFWVSKIC